MINRLRQLSREGAQVVLGGAQQVVVDGAQVGHGKAGGGSQGAQARQGVGLVAQAEGVGLGAAVDGHDDLVALVQLHQAAQASGVPLVVGAGMAPGLSGLLARYLADQLHSVEELHVATHGTAGPACAHQHHRALGDTAIGGRIPVNPSGGLACFGEAIPAQAIAQVCELTWQLRGEATGRQVDNATAGITANLMSLIGAVYYIFFIGVVSTGLIVLLAVYVVLSLGFVYAWRKYDRAGMAEPMAGGSITSA